MSESRKSFKNFFGAFCSQPLMSKNNSNDEDVYFHKADESKSFSTLSRRNSSRKENSFSSSTQPPFLIKEIVSPENCHIDNNEKTPLSGNIPRSQTLKNSNMNTKTLEIPASTRKMFKEIQKKIFEGKVSDIDESKILQNIEKQIRNSPDVFESVLKDTCTINSNGASENKKKNSNLTRIDNGSSGNDYLQDLSSGSQVNETSSFQIAHSKIAFAVHDGSNNELIFTNTSMKKPDLPYIISHQSRDVANAVYTSDVSKEIFDSKILSDGEERVSSNVDGTTKAALLDNKIELNLESSKYNCLMNQSLITNDGDDSLNTTAKTEPFELEFHDAETSFSKTGTMNKPNDFFDVEEITVDEPKITKETFVESENNHPISYDYSLEGLNEEAYQKLPSSCDGIKEDNLLVNDAKVFDIKSKVGDVLNNTMIDTTFEVNRVCDEILTELDETEINVSLESENDIELSQSENRQELAAILDDSQFELSSSLLQKMDGEVREVFNLPQVTDIEKTFPVSKPKLCTNIGHPFEHPKLPPLPTMVNHQVDWAAKIKMQSETMKNILDDIAKINSTINRYRSSLMRKDK